MKSTHFSDYLSPRQIIFNLKAEDKIGSLTELLDKLKKLNLIQARKPILTRIVDRERLETTGLGHGIALPHARMDTGHDLTVAVGRSKNGIDFEAIDGKKVHLIILVVWSPSIPGLFNHLFAGLAKFLIKPKVIERVFSAKNATELFNILSKIELELPEGEADLIMHRGGLLWKLQEIEIQMRKARGDKKKKLEKQTVAIRDELDSTLLDRFDRLMERYGFAVAEVDDGACQGCYINLATGMSSAIEGSNDLYVCENCGKFLVAKQEKE